MKKKTCSKDLKSLFDADVTGKIAKAFPQQKISKTIERESSNKAPKDKSAKASKEA